MHMFFKHYKGYAFDQSVLDELGADGFIRERFTIENELVTELDFSQRLVDVASRIRANKKEVLPKDDPLITDFVRYLDAQVALGCLL